MLTFNNLILLIGTNPLPNYVVADYFIQKNDSLKNIWLLHSSGSERQLSTLLYAEKIKELIGRRYPKKLTIHIYEYGIDDVSNPSSIIKPLERCISSAKGSLHLDYTGGTKTMGVHAFYFLKECAVDFSYSYLNARKFQIVINDEGNIPDRDLREVVNIDFTDLIVLHGYQRANTDKEFLFNDTIKIFQEIIRNGDIIKFFDRVDGYKRDLFFEKGRPEIAEKVSRIKNIEQLKTFRPNNVLKMVNDSLPDSHKIFIDDTFNVNLNNNQFRQVIKDFLDGKWQEHYVNSVLYNADFVVKGKIKLLTNWEIKKPDWPNNSCFEIDVVMIKGYQLTGISCTTADSKARCKSKGFEVFLRTRQIGGDEAKAILICRADMNTTEAVQKELTYDSGTPEGTILVLGRDSWKRDDMISKIQNFINS